MACKFQVGDVIVGNDLADSQYAITDTGWIGQVVSADKLYFNARTFYEGIQMGEVFPCLDYNCFDLLEPELDAEQVQQMKTML